MKQSVFVLYIRGENMKRKKSNKWLINIFFISAIFGILIGIIIANYEDNNQKGENYKLEKLSTEQEVKVKKEYPKEEVLQTYKGYSVCARLEIPKVSLTTPILSEYSKKALDVSATKFWGAEPNTEGNFCVAGHNAKNLFRKIKKLNLGDSLFIIDKLVGKVEYEVFKIDTVSPKDVTCLDALTTGEKEVTFITCTNDSQKRYIVKAKEKIE